MESRCFVQGGWRFGRALVVAVSLLVGLTRGEEIDIYYGCSEYLMDYHPGDGKLQAWCDWGTTALHTDNGQCPCGQEGDKVCCVELVNHGCCDWIQTPTYDDSPMSMDGDDELDHYIGTQGTCNVLLIVSFWDDSVGKCAGVGVLPVFLTVQAWDDVLVHEVGHIKGIVGDYYHYGRIMHMYTTDNNTRLTSDECSAFKGED